ncbi:MAG: SprT family zinc-dependent metalloprotease [Coxiellaceae bacterium]|nr:SprT family zinc-dependent metalloprotease [Coxiellaceae bacterium]
MNSKLDGLDVVITQKKIKNTYLRVCSSTGKVKVSAPKKMSIESIHHFVLSKLKWIQQQQKKISTAAPIGPKKYNDGEKHYFNGQCFLLKVIACEKKPHVMLLDAHIVISVHPNATKIKKQALLDHWYCEQLTEKTALLIAKWERIMAVSVSRFSIRNMKTRWGSCSPKSRAIRINLALAKKSLDCLEYVVVHELAHLLEPSHNKRFVSLMDRFLPDWRVSCRELNNPI